LAAGRWDPETAEETVCEIRGWTWEIIWETISDWRLDWENEDCSVEEEDDPDPGRTTVKPVDWGLEEEDVEDNPEEDAPELEPKLD